MSEINLENFQDIPNVMLLDENVIGGGMPPKEALEKAKAQGIKTIIDLRTMMEGTMFEKGIVEKLGMKYVNIPISSQEIDQSQIDKLAEVLQDEANLPVIVHCAVGGRVNFLWNAYKRDE